MKSWFESRARESRNKQIPAVEGGRQLRDVLLRCVITLCVVLKQTSVHRLLRLPFQGAYTVLEKRTHYKSTDCSEHPPTTPVSHLSVSVYLTDSNYFPQNDYCLLLLRGDSRSTQIALPSPQMFLSRPVSPFDLLKECVALVWREMSSAPHLPFPPPLPDKISFCRTAKPMCATKSGWFNAVLPPFKSSVELSKRDPTFLFCTGSHKLHSQPCSLPAGYSVCPLQWHLHMLLHALLSGHNILSCSVPTVRGFL